MSAAGRSRPNAAASFARTARPPSVPITAPTAPATSAPIHGTPPAMPIAAPLTAPVTTRVANCIGTVRLGVDGSWSVTSSPIASTVRIHGVHA